MQLLQPRVIRLTVAVKYCGVCQRVFNSDFRPYLQEIRVGKQGIGFDRIEVDKFLDEKFAKGVSWKKVEKQTRQASTLKMVSISSTKRTKGTGFLSELESVINLKR